MNMTDQATITPPAGQPATKPEGRFLHVLLPPELDSLWKETMEIRGYATESEAIRDLIRNCIKMVPFREVYAHHKQTESAKQG